MNDREPGTPDERPKGLPVAAGDKPYREVMEAWRTSCPRLPVWEEATDRGLITRRTIDGAVLVTVTSLGRSWLRLPPG